MDPRPLGKSWLNLVAIVACGCVLVLSGILSYSAALTKSATHDEPVEALGGWIQLHMGDFRINFEHPPLWHYWAALSNGSNAIRFSPDDEMWLAMPSDVLREWPFAARTLYQTAGNDGAAFINRSRAMMLLLGLSLAALTSIWSWKLGGPLAAIVAAFLFALDPNIIAHESIVKNDVALGLMMTGVFFVAWRVGNRLTIANALLLSLLVAAAINVKFSALLLGPMLIVLFAIRVALPQPWNVPGMTLTRWPIKTAVASLLCVLIALVSYFSIWACYRFRFNPSPDPAIRLNPSLIQSELANLKFCARYPPPRLIVIAPDAPVAAFVDKFREKLNTFMAQRLELESMLAQPNLSKEHADEIRGVLAQVKELEKSGRDAIDEASRFSNTLSSPPDLRGQILAAINTLQDRIYTLSYFIDRMKHPDAYTDWFADFIESLRAHRLFPEAWLNGLLKVYAESYYRESFLMGQLSGTGWWYYFPLAMLFKMPISSGIVFLGAMVMGLMTFKHRRQSWRDFAWPVASLVVPLVIFTAAAIKSRMDIGWRYMIPVFPLLCIASGALLARWIAQSRRAVIAASILGVVLLVETVSAWPGYISFFSLPFKSSRIHLLSDSNLDWGQDLPLLAKWQKAHPDVPLAAALFGSPDPAYYGLHFDPLPKGYPDPQLSRTHILAVSATKLQDAYRDGYDVYQRFTPFEILGGTIYLYDLRSKP